MKLKYLVYGAVALVAVVAAVLAYLTFAPTGGGKLLGSQASALDGSTSVRAALTDRGKTVSGKAGRLALAYTGDLAGSLRPCGCTEPAMGGVARRATALRDYVRKHGDVAVLQVETGNALKQSDNLDDPASRWIVQALNELGTHAVNTTAGDLRRLARLAETGRLPDPLRTVFVATNVDQASVGRAPVKPFVVQSVTPDAGGEPVRVGVLAVSAATDPSGTVKSLPTEKAVERYLPEVERQSDVVVLLTRATDSEMVRLAHLFPGVDVIVNGSPTSEGREFPKVGNTQIVEAAHGGIALGMLEISWDSAGRIQKAANTMIPLPPQVPDEQRLADLVEKAHREAVTIAEEAARNAPVVTGASIFAGSAKCKECHEKAFRVWEKTGHAHAIEALRKTGDHFNPECVECHVTGYGVGQGFVNVTQTPNLANIQCEGCHGPSLSHVANPQTMHPGLGEMRLFRRPVRKAFCERCHTHDNSPRFDFAVYWPKIAH
jgi:2',3'-cyclic-nucleotide 2'-phosphodiesterase (5'-nucleotidase family)